MEIILHIGLPHCGAGRLQEFLDSKRDQLIGKGILYPRAPGRRNHTKLFMAVTDPDHIDPLRWGRGYAPEPAQKQLAQTLRKQLEHEIAAAAPQKLILSADQLGASLWRPSEIQRLRDYLAPFSTDIRILAHIDEQARVLARHYGEQVIEGRTASLLLEIDVAQDDDWRGAALAYWQQCDPMLNLMPEIQAPPFWLDYAGLVKAWETEFGQGSVDLRPYDAQVFASPAVASEAIAAFSLPGNIGKAAPGAPEQQPAAASTARSRAMNHLFEQALKAGRIIPRQMWRRMQGQLEVPGAPIQPGSLAAVSARFAKDNAALAKVHPGLELKALLPDSPLDDWQEAAPGFGFRATQYFTVFLPMIDKVTAEERQRKKDAIAALSARHGSAGGDKASADGVSNGTPSPLLPPLAQANYIKLKGGRFAPHNNIGRTVEDLPGEPYPILGPRKLPKGSTGNVIVACMKNEGPYIVEWVAYHRVIGVDNFVIYTNGCEDGTSEILERLQDMGVLEHRNNDAWKGNSPQQYALNRSLKEPVVKNADWVIHIDVDEFINVRCGNGTLADFFERIPGATNVAMTWRLFGNAGIASFDDRPVIEQFDRCAPKYCPKPHTVWGFKTMSKNIGAYEKLSCHRPNKLIEERRDDVLWVNGSGAPMGDAVKEKGWRSEMRSIGYDLIQLNHYALRSAESFMIKRQRGRALHVDRTIGLNYWVRMDWSENRDLTIQRNMDRLRAEMAALLADETLAALHAQAADWHRAKAEELHRNPEFEDLFQQAQTLQLTEMERVAYALALDMES